MSKRRATATTADEASDAPDVDVLIEGAVDHTVLQDGTIIDGNFYNEGDVVALHPDVAARLMECDVRLKLV